MTSTTWETLIPATKGVLHSGEPVYRTDPGGCFDADILILGLYPAATVVKQVKVGNRRMNLPMSVERTSFEPGSASGLKIDTHYLGPLGLTRADVLLIDLLPYFLANTRGSKGRTMRDNIVEYERVTGQQLGIEARPDPHVLLDKVRSMPGNLYRLGDYFTRCQPKLVLTLGVEAAAFVRDVPFRVISKQARATFYGEPESMTILDVEAKVVHLAHPGIMMIRRGPSTWWAEQHRAWSEGVGRACVEKGLGR